MELSAALFSSAFMPQKYCLGDGDLLWLHAVSDGAIALAYLLIPFGLFLLLRKRHDLVFQWLFYLFGLFILSCGATHVLEIVTLWSPVYPLAGFVKVVTAVASLSTAAVLFRLMPKIASYPSFTQWERANEALKTEIAEHHSAELDVRSLNAKLTEAIGKRTAELKEVAQNREELAIALESSQAFIFKPDGTITHWSRGSQALYGWLESEAVGQLASSLLKTTFPRPWLDIEEKLLARGSWEGELTQQTKAGDTVHVMSRMVLQRSSDPATVSVIQVNTDITESKAAEARYQLLSRRLQSIREEERAHLAREIHDVLGQTLTIIKLHLATADQRFSSDPTTAAAKLREGLSCVDQTIRDLHRVASELRPPTLDMAGLAEALRTYAQEFEEKTGIEIDFLQLSAIPVLAPEQSINAFRVVQESLTNVVRHSAATLVNVSLGYRSEALEISVRDNGAGFLVSNAAGQQSLGLLGMEERAKAANGTLRIQSELGVGTHVTLRLPI